MKVKTIEHKYFSFAVLSFCLIFAMSSAFSQTSKPTAESDSQKEYPCLESGIGLDDIVSFATDDSPKITVKDKLAAMKARCLKGKLVDKKCREIRFVKEECWGNPPADYLEIQERRRKEVAELKKKYTVIEMPCNRLQIV
ncbi:MAG: hypothetical protein ACRD6X_09380 [Pyrinomonadaceae bacterium]